MTKSKVTKIGITGGIGSGKSYVCNLLRQRGLPVYDCDNEAKRIMKENSDVRHQLCELVGNDAYNGTELDRQVMASFLFANAMNGQKINAIVHPVVKEDFMQWAERQTSPVVVQECALLFEAGFRDTVDYAVAVYAPLQLQLQRVVQRDKATQEQVAARMKQQLNNEEKRKMADFCIVNDGIADLDQQIDNILTTINNYA